MVARQRPATANGIVFMLLEDEFGTINLIVPPAVYATHRLVVRGEPLVLADGRLEKHPAGGGAINIVVDEIARLEGGARRACRRHRAARLGFPGRCWAGAAKRAISALWRRR